MNFQFVSTVLVLATLAMSTLSVASSSKVQRKLIVGGHDIEPERYPYFVSIDKNNGVIVNGALIAPDIVLSAGHIALNHMDNLTLKVGPYAVHEIESFAETIAVQNWTVYPKWTQFEPGWFRDDYIILQLADKSTHKPIRINRDVAVPPPGELVTMVGLGWLNESFQSPASIVQEVELLSISNEECDAADDPKRPGLAYKGKIDESMICTKSPPDTSRDGCAWDSGDPVIIPGATSEEDLLVALGSTGIGCADPIFPAIQARLATKHDHGWNWIREKVCQLSTDPPSDFDCANMVATSSEPAADSTPVSSTIALSANVGPVAGSTNGIVTVDGLVVGCLLLSLLLVIGALRSWKDQRSAKAARVQRVVLDDTDGRKLAFYGSIEC